MEPLIVLSEKLLGWPRAAAAGLAAALVAACSPVGILNAVVPNDGYVASKDISYGDDPRQKADVFSPRPDAGNAAPAGGYPVVVFFYGGSWNQGNRKDYRFVAEALTSKGMVVVLADYRLYPQVRYPDFLVDSARAVAWAWRNAATYGGNPAKLFVMGHSAGAYNAAMLALDYPKGAQPIEHAANRSSRVLLGAAARDSVVNPGRNTAGLAAALRASGTPVTVKIYENASHISIAAALARPLRAIAPVLEDVSAFINAP